MTEYSITNLQNNLTRAAILLLMVLAMSLTASATDFITDVMVAGNKNQSQFNTLIGNLEQQGWTDISQDLNQGCGSGSDYIHLLYKRQSSSGNTGVPITDFYIRTGANPPDNLTYGGRTYYLVPYQGSDSFTSGQGDLNNNAGGTYIHLYYTKDALSNNKGVTTITFNTTQSGAVGENGGSTGYDLNTGCGSSSAYIYMHFTTTSGANVVTLSSGSGNVSLQNGHILTGTGGADTHVTIADGATVTLSGVNITAIVNDGSHVWPGISCLGNATIVLSGSTTNSVKGGYQSSGIFVPQGKYLTLQGSGILNATGGFWSAGIGSGKQQICGNITISGGTINATGGQYGAGIGSGYSNSACGTIIINGGTVTATGGQNAAGIGSGYYNSECWHISIYNTVTGVTATKGTGCNNAIGAGGGNSTCQSVTIGSVETGFITQSPFETFPYTVVFNANGGTHSMANQSFMYNVAQNLFMNTFTRTYYEFEGWATSPDGPKVYDDEQSVSNLTATSGATVTLYAKWIPVFSYTVAFNPNGGTGTMNNQSFTYNVAQNLTPNSFSRTYYTFEGWATSADGPKVYDDTQSVSNLTQTPCDTVTLYAKWIPAFPYTVAFNANGGTGTMNNQSFTYNVAQNLTANSFTRQDYLFVGWATSPDGPKVYNDGQRVKNLTQTPCDTVTLYAKWVWYGTIPGELLLHDGDTLTGTGGPHTHVSIADGATVTFSGVDITTILEDDDHRWPGITCLGDAVIVLAEGTTNSVKGGFDSPGIYVPQSKSLTLRGGGTLNATGGGGAAAGIGSGYESSCGNIIISGGTVTATGGDLAAGIGSGWNNSSCGNIILSGGFITATGGNAAAGIGSGFNYSSCGDITISGSTVTATGGGAAAGIGSGRDSSCDNITISGGSITATGGEWAAGIGSGYGSSTCGTVTISGGTVTANGGQSAAGIGSGYDNSSCGDITITNGVTMVTATKGDNCEDAIGCGWGYSSCGTITIGSVETGTIRQSPFTTFPYTVAFNANGGTGTMNDQSFMYNVADSLTANSFTYSGHAFQGWATSANGPKVYDDGQSVSNLADTITTVTLYAKWTANPTHVQTIALSAGWNWVSFYIDEDPIELLQMLEESLGENGIVIKGGDITTEYDEEWGWFGDLDEEGIVNEQMYLVRTVAACTVELEGTPANPANHAITINPGWNWIGFPCSVSVGIEDALSGFNAAPGDILKCGDISTEYDEEWGWFGDIETLEPGQGFLYYSNASTPKTLVFQTVANTKRKGIGRN